MEQNNFNPKAKSRSKMTIINSASGILSKFVILAANFAIRTIFIYYLGIEYTGVSAVFSNILTILSFAELGIGSAITFALYKPIEQNDYRQLAKLMAFYRKAYFIIGSTVFAVGICLTPFLKFLINNVPDVKENITVICCHVPGRSHQPFLADAHTLICLSHDPQIYRVQRNLGQNTGQDSGNAQSCM